MSAAGTRVSVSVEVGVQVRRAEAIYGILTFALDVLRLGHHKCVLEKGVLRNPWLDKLGIVGLDTEDRVVEELVFEIDWERHQLHMDQGRGMITVPNGRSLVASVSPDLMTSLRLFKEACLGKGLNVACYVWRREVPGLDTSRELGLGEACALKYAGAKLQAPLGTGDLDEVSGSYNRYGP